MHTNGTFIVDFYNNLLGTSLQLQSTTTFINWRTNSTFRNALNGNLVIGPTSLSASSAPSPSRNAPLR